MRRPSLVLGALLGGLSSLPLIALSFLGEQWGGLPFVPFDLFDWLVRVLPGNVITTGIDSMVRLITLFGLGPTSAVAKRLEQLQGILLVIAGGVMVGLLVAGGMRRSRRPGYLIGAVVGGAVFLFVAGTEISLGVPLAHGPFAALLWLAFLIVGWGVALGVSLASPFLGTAPLPTTPQAHLARRTLLKFVAGSLGVTIVAGGVGWLLQLQQRSSRAGQPLAPSGTSSPGPLSTASATPGPAEPAAAETPATTTAEATSRNQVPPAPGTRPEVTSNENFYQVDIDTRPPDIDGGSWALQVSGLFERPRALTLSALRAYPSVTQPITLSCISNPVGGDLISTAYLVGVPLRVVLKDLGLRPEAKALNLKAADGFYESAALEDMQDSRTLLVYGMNGQMLPMGHGFPLRIYIPNRYGMKQPKWIMSMEATDARGPGYWVDRGWSLEAHPQIVSVIDTVAKDKIENSRAPIGGIAWAGDRGIQKVEIQVDDGPWVPTILRTPPLGSLTWIQWRYDWRPTSGTHTFRVRATDGTGALQIPDVRDTYPDGATGYHSVTMTI